MNRIKVTVSYDGSAYSGWQSQPNAQTVQQTIEDALYELTKEKIKIYGSGRTDVGVHAIGQVFHMDTNSTIPGDRLYKALNTVLPDDIVAVNSELVDEEFNARYTAKEKTYLYKMYIGEMPKPYERNYKLFVYGNLNVNKMREASKLLVGEHDFVGFSSTGSSVSTTVREIKAVSLDVVNDEIHFRVTGNGFLYNMVRIIVGTLIEIGKERMPINQINEVLESKKRNRAGKTASAVGLYLEKVNYSNKTLDKN